MATRKPVVEVAPLPTRAQWATWVNEQVNANPAFVPPNQLCVEDIDEWNDCQQQLGRLKSREMLLRLRIFQHVFPTPDEGANNAKLADGLLIKGQYKIDRKVDEALLSVMKAPNPDLDGKSIFEVGGINPDKLVKYEPSLITGEYRELTDEQRILFERVLIMKPGAPSMTIEVPKAA